MTTTLPKYKLVDLCSGTGGFSLAFENTHLVECVFANDFDSNSKLIYDLNFDVPLSARDITKLNVSAIPDCDILTCGFPCQGFSIAGKQLGFKDKRSNVFWKLIKIMREKSPQIVVLENVKNLISHDEGRTFRIILREIEELGYFVRYKILNTSAITGIPQHRERIYIVCFKDEVQADLFDFPSDENVEMKEISSFFEANVDDKYYYSDKYKVWETIRDNVVKENVVYQYRRFYVRENMSGVCPTLTSNMGQGGHNCPLIKDKKGIRKLTPRECFNLQGFPQSFILPNISDNHLYKLAGNAVSIQVVELLANEIIKVLQN